MGNGDKNSSSRIETSYNFFFDLMCSNISSSTVGITKLGILLEKLYTRNIGSLLT